MMSKTNKIKVGLLEDFSRKNGDTMCWLLAMKAYFGMNQEINKDKKNIIIVFLNKMSKGKGGAFTEGWYLKLINEDIPKSEKMFKKLCDAFKETFILKDIKD